MREFVLADLLELTKDGEWGKGDPLPDLEPMLVIRGTDFANARYSNIMSVPVRYIPRAIAERKALQPGDILIETAGGTKDQPTGRTVFLKEQLFRLSEMRFTCASFSRFLRVKKNLVRPDYLFWFLQNLYHTGRMYPFHIQHTGVARFQYTQFAKTQSVPVPDLSEQDGIATLLNSIDDKIDLNRRMNETLEAMAQAIFKDWLVDFGPTRAKIEGRPPYLAPDIWALFPDRLGDEGRPEAWTVGTLADYANLNPENWSRVSYPLFVRYVDLSGTKWGTIENIEPHSRDDAPSRAQRVLRPGDTIVGMVRPGNGSYAFVSEDGLTGSTGFAALRPMHRDTREFVYLAVTTRENIDRLAHLADGGAYPAVRPEVVMATVAPIVASQVIGRSAGQQGR
jgi:type I restriction enzyme S subunit